MTFYEQELNRIRSTVYANQRHLDIVIKTRNYIEHNYASNLNLDGMAEALCISKYHLLRLFKKYYGLTPKQFVTDRRIAHSKEHLKSGMTVTETCFTVGFESLGSFSTLFRSKTGKSPAQFKKEQLSRSNSIPGKRYCH